MILFNTDILIFAQRGNIKAARAINNATERKISLLTYMELMQSPSSKQQHHKIKKFLLGLNFEVIPLNQKIGHRAAIYIEEYSLTNGIRLGDALIAATATEYNLTLLSSNKKHFKLIKDLNLKVFHP